MYKQSATYNNYMQDPTSQQGFNRYAYCMYNPLKYVDPTGERQIGWVSSTYQFEQAAKHVFRQWGIVYDDIVFKHALSIAMANSIYSDGTDACGGRSGSGNHGSGGGGRHASTSFNELNHNQCLSLTDGLCVLTSLGIIYGGDDSKAWERRALAYMSTFQKNPFDPNNLVEFINWNPDLDNYHSYECEEINFTGIYDAMNDGYVVSFMCDFTEEMVNEFGLKSKGHFVNLSYIDITENGCISIGFNDYPLNNYFIDDYKSCNSNMFIKDDYKRYMYHIQKNKPIMEIPRVIKTRIKKTIP